MNKTYYDGPGLGLSSLGQAADSLSPASPVTLTIRPTGAMLGAWWSLSTVSGILSAYHGLKRSGGNLGWALAWFLAGSALPVIVPIVAFSQGYAKPAPRLAPNRGRSGRRRRSR